MEHAPRFGQTELGEAISSALQEKAVDQHQLVFID
jgi:hypothetical protein